MVSTVAEPNKEAVTVAIMTLPLEFFYDHVVDFMRMRLATTKVKASRFELEDAIWERFEEG